jgi:hypothetical protein
VNLSYIPRTLRKKFTQEWQYEYARSNGDIEFTWDLVQNKYPYLSGAVRRYFFKPNYYIQGAQHIHMDEMESAVVSTWARDFSSKVKRTLVKTFRNLTTAKRTRRI